MESRKIRYAVIGAGNIAQVAILPSFEHARENSRLVALISGDAEKRAELSKRYDLEFYGDYSELEPLLTRAAVDAVYIATPNALHKEHALRAARVGAHVLCEKPLAGSVADAEIMLEACEDAGVKLMTAYRLHFEQANLEAIELVRSGKLGEPRVFDSVFTHVVRPGDIRQRPDLQGGAALDLGVYCINAARHLFGDEPVLVFATAQLRNGVDETTTALLQFPRGRVAQFTVSSACASVSSYRVAGSDGDLRVEPAYDYAAKLEHFLTIDEKTSHKSFGKRDQFAPQIEYFSNCILQDREPEPSAEEAICDLRVVEAILASAASGKPVPLEPWRRARRPNMQQEIKKPPISKPDTLNAPSPSLK